MLRIDKTHDMDLVKSLWTDPRIYSKMCVDGCPPSEEYYPKDSVHRIWLIPKMGDTPIGVIAFYEKLDNLWEGHIGILPDYCYGKIVIKSMCYAMKWLFNNTTADLIKAEVSFEKIGLKKLLLRLGFNYKTTVWSPHTRDGKPFTIDVFTCRKI